MSALKPKITGKHSKKHKQKQRTENQITKYKLSGGQAFTFILSEGRFAHMPPVSYATGSMQFLWTHCRSASVQVTGLVFQSL